MEKEYEFINRIKAYCRQNELFARGDRVLLGLSGGADSVCLFLVLQALGKDWDLTIMPVHVNHNLRGEEALRDQQFCEELCRQYQQKLHVASVDVSGLAKENNWSLEEAGRNARYESFARWKEEWNCQKIAVAHHKDDQAETVLFQLFRGSRLKGLAGMEAKNGDLVRPLLDVTREEIEGYLREKKQNFCIDHTNLEEEYTRNRIRHRIVPEAREICDRAVEHIADAAEYAGRVEGLLERLTNVLFRESAAEDTEGNVTLKIEPLKAAEPILAERVIYRALCRVYGRKKDITAGFVEVCMELMEKQTGRYLQLPEGIIARKSFDVLWIGREKEVQPFYEEISSFPYRTELLPEQGILELFLKKREELEENIPKSTYTKWFDYDKISNMISLKTPQAEDEIVLYTDGRKKRVNDVLAEAKVSQEKRQRLKVLAAGNQILWIPGIRGSEGYYVTKETKYVLIATINGGSENGR